MVGLGALVVRCLVGAVLEPLLAALSYEHCTRWLLQTPLADQGRRPTVIGDSRCAWRLQVVQCNDAG
jgi:hypothetical protein